MITHPRRRNLDDADGAKSHHRGRRLPVECPHITRNELSRSGLGFSHTNEAPKVDRSARRRCRRVTVPSAPFGPLRLAITLATITLGTCPLRPHNSLRID